MFSYIWHMWFDYHSSLLEIVIMVANQVSHLAMQLWKLYRKRNLG